MLCLPVTLRCLNPRLQRFLLVPVESLTVHWTLAKTMIFLPSVPQLSQSGWLILSVIYAPLIIRKKLPLTELIIRLIPTPAPDSESLPDHVTCPPRFQQHCSCCRRGCIVYCDNSCQRSKQMSTAHWWMFLSAAGGKGWAEPRPKAVEATARWWWFMAIVCGKCDGQMPAAVVVFSFILWFCCGLSAACQMGKKRKGRSWMKDAIHGAVNG